MKCEKCGQPVTKTLSDNCVSKIKRYQTVAYYCSHCDEILILDKYKDVLPAGKYDQELTWLRSESREIKNKGW